MPQILLRRLVCDEPDTSFGDDIEIIVDGVGTGQFNIDQGEIRNFTEHPHPPMEVEEFGETVHFQIKEDSDPKLDFDRSATEGKHRDEIRFGDGRYQLFWKVSP